MNFPCTGVDLSYTAIQDFICFRAMPLNELNVSHTQVVELHSLYNSEIKKLNISYTAISDLTKLRALPLEELNISHSNVRELSAVPFLTQLQKLVVHRGQIKPEEIEKMARKIEVQVID